MLLYLLISYTGQNGNKDTLHSGLLVYTVIEETGILCNELASEWLFTVSGSNTSFPILREPKTWNLLL